MAFSAADRAAIAETHISVLVSLGDRVYKLKKPVALDFLDFSSREARERACHREVELNRRLAPDVYLGVADVVGEDGVLCDHLVVMRRMPADRRLARLVKDGQPVDDALDEVARRIAVFHATAPTGEEISAAGRRDAVGAVWEASFDQLGPFTGPVLDPRLCRRVEHLVRRYLAGRAPLFDHRIALGAVRDGHGDLQAEDIFCLDDGPRILDCIEFDDRLRHGDVLADVAFLAMDLERLGAPDAAARFLARSKEFAGGTHPESLVHHYIAARAHVRCKVACFRHAQGDAEAAGAARSLLDLTVRHLEAARVRLVLVGGLPGTGKSTVAAGLADATGWSVLRSDEVRKDRAGLGHATPAPAAPGEGLYRPAVTDATYAELLRRAGTALAQGESVILDASWSAERHRRAAAGVAEATASDLVELCCVAPPALAEQRISRRLATGADPSDATPLVAAAMAGRFDPWPAASTVDTSGRVQPAVDRARSVSTATSRSPRRTSRGSMPPPPPPTGG
ncbi:MAG TPA: AAA family ATPase [Acidimicrobiia bacterium]|nr:AAA family ATPase [Acidimicrobiia bacterium]